MLIKMMDLETHQNELWEALPLLKDRVFIIPFIDEELFDKHQCEEITEAYFSDLLAKYLPDILNDMPDQVRNRIYEYVSRGTFCCFNISLDNDDKYSLIFTIDPSDMDPSMLHTMSQKTISETFDMQANAYQLGVFINDHEIAEALIHYFEEDFKSAILVGQDADLFKEIFADTYACLRACARNGSLSTSYLNSVRHIRNANAEDGQDAHATQPALDFLASPEFRAEDYQDMDISDCFHAALEIAQQTCPEKPSLMNRIVSHLGF